MEMPAAGQISKAETEDFGLKAGDGIDVELFFPRECLAILFGPIAVGGHCLHRRATLSSARTWPLSLGFSHARAGLRL